MMEKSNILLIGMPGSGKTTVGKILAKKTGMPHIDIDKSIESREGLKLQQIIESKGLEYFSALEEQVLLETEMEGGIISTGGSAVYYPKAMEQLRKNCIVVYLQTDPKTLLAHIRNLDSRGIAFKPGQSFDDIYNERRPLYEKYSDVTIKAGLESPQMVADSVIETLSLKTSG